MNLVAIASLGLAAVGLALAGCGGSGGGSGNSPLMLPGHDCMTCHTAFTAAGTVFDASGAGADGVTVTVGSVTLTSNAGGNFYTATSAVTFPAPVAIALGGGTRTMASPAQDGHCNRCHDGVTQPKITAP